MAIPSKSSPHAPSFSGKPVALVRFLDEVHKIATDNTLQTEQEIINLVIVYSNDDDYELWKGLPTAGGGIWQAFKDELI